MLLTVLPLSGLSLLSCRVSVVLPSLLKSPSPLMGEFVQLNRISTGAKLINKLTSRADSVYEQDNGPRIFKEPATIDMTIEHLLKLTSQPGNVADSSSDTLSNKGHMVAYLQSQNSNLSEAPLKQLLPDLPSPPTFARKALNDQEPDATNIWIGDHNAVTSLHRDPYENLYLVIKGSKTFTLFSPLEEICMYTESCQHAQWQLDDASTGVFSTKVTDPPQHLPWVMVDPLNPDFERCPLFKYARPLTVTVNPGEILFLPSSWYHHVQQAQGQWSPELLEEDSQTCPCIAINWWTDQVRLKLSLSDLLSLSD